MVYAYGNIYYMGIYCEFDYTEPLFDILPEFPLFVQLDHSYL